MEQLSSPIRASNEYQRGRGATYNVGGRQEGIEENVEEGPPSPLFYLPALIKGHTMEAMVDSSSRVNAIDLGRPKMHVFFDTVLAPHNHVPNKTRKQITAFIFHVLNETPYPA